MNVQFLLKKYVGLLDARGRRSPFILLYSLCIATRVSAAPSLIFMTSGLVPTPYGGRVVHNDQTPNGRRGEDVLEGDLQSAYDKTFRNGDEPNET